MTPPATSDVAIIGAGPAGTVAAALLARKGWRVTVLERQTFPRFSIGESLLPQCMEHLAEAGMIDAVNCAGFQVKTGAVFERGGETTCFDFSNKSSSGPSTTFQVQRARFDEILAGEAVKAGAEIFFGHEIKTIEFSDEATKLTYVGADGRQNNLTAKFCLDASGFAKKLLQDQSLERSPIFPPRQAIFTHIVDAIDDPSFDRERILITAHPQKPDVWFWLIPFENGTSSLGVVGNVTELEGGEAEARLRALATEAGALGVLLKNATYIQPVQRVTHYAASASRLYGKRYALLGNAGGFLDPIFSSGVTIALKSASLAAAVLDRKLNGAAVDWEAEFANPLSLGLDTFSAFVEAWYRGDLLDIFLMPKPVPRIKKMLCSILAGYAWDESNPFVIRPHQRLSALAEICRKS